MASLMSLQVIYGDGGVVIVDTGYYSDGYVVYLAGCGSSYLCMWCWAYMSQAWLPCARLASPL